MGEDSWAYRSSRKVPVSPTGRGRFRDDETPWFDVAPGGLSPLRSERMYAATPGLWRLRPPRDPDKNATTN